MISAGETQYRWSTYENTTAKQKLFMFVNSSCMDATVQFIQNLYAIDRVMHVSLRYEIQKM